MRASITPKYGPFHVSMADIISLVLVHVCDIIFHIITLYPLFCHWSRASSSVNLLHDFLRTFTEPSFTTKEEKLNV